MNDKLQAVILVILDRYSNMEAEDVTPAMCELLKRELGAHVYRIEIVPDEPDIIASRLQHYSELHSIDLALTIGGTGFFPAKSGSDPVRKLIHHVPAGLEQSIKALSPSHQVEENDLKGFSGLYRNRTVIVSLPGPQIAAFENLARILPALKRTLRIQGGRKMRRGDREMKKIMKKR
jgi:molybdopterin biosynthesis enzyme MoaB